MNRLLPNLFRLAIAPLCLICLCAGDRAAATYTNDFSAAEVGKTPQDLAILSGNFTVVADGGGKCLELAGDPVEPGAFLFGPAGQTTTTVRARIHATASGKRFPELGIGAGDSAGFRLILVPTTGQIELRKGEDFRAAAPCPWKSGSWMNFRLAITAGPNGGSTIQGKAWPDGAAEPSDWTLAATDPAAPPAGRALGWANPYSETPIRFADLSVAP